MEARDKLIVALDVADPSAARALIAGLGETVGFYKIGYQLLLGGGLDLVRELVAGGRRVFLDLKMHDIANTVTEGTAAAAALGVSFLTVHAYPQTMRAAAAGARGSALRILGVTVLTSYDEADVSEAGYGLRLEALVLRRAEQAREAAIHGLVASPAELAVLRRSGLMLVTPGVRPSGSPAGDQKRVATPAQAIRGGADYVVVGRPIVQAADPKAAAAAVLAEVEAALAG